MKFNDIESDLEINIEGKYVVKFDQHKYFKYFSGQSRKGVDYMVIGESYLYLIEIKNYQQYPNTIRPTEKELYQVFYEKCEDSLAIIEAFSNYMNSSWYRRKLILDKEWYFLGLSEWKPWVEAVKLMQSNQVILLLHGI